MKADQETKQTTMENHGGVGHWKKTVAKGDRPKGTATGGTLDTVTRSLTEDLESSMCKVTSMFGPSDHWYMSIRSTFDGHSFFC